jgi:hypothetical protein
MTRYAYGQRFCGKDRVHITWEWNKIQKDMEVLLKEMDTEVAYKIECLSEPKK